MKENNIVAIKSFQFAIDIVNLSKRIVENKKEFVLSKQLLRCGTAVGDLIKEAEHAQSKLDFLNKINISLKEANETGYWLELLNATQFITHEESTTIHQQSIELVKLLSSIVISTKKSLNKL